MQAGPALKLYTRPPLTPARSSEEDAAEDAAAEVRTPARAPPPTRHTPTRAPEGRAEETGMAAMARAMRGKVMWSATKKKKKAIPPARQRGRVPGRPTVSQGREGEGRFFYIRPAAPTSSLRPEGRGGDPPPDLLRRLPQAHLPFFQFSPEGGVGRESNTSCGLILHVGDTSLYSLA